MSKDKNRTKEYIELRVKWHRECWEHIKKANYKNATDHAFKGLTLFPNDLFVEFSYYSILADYALSDPQKLARIHKKAVNGMRNCLRKTRGAKAEAVINFKNEYYYQTKQFLKQYHLGINSYKKFKDKYDFYSAGVGGANHALHLAKKNQMKRAHSWAKKSISAWHRYFEVNDTYYNSYVHYALAKGILGDRKGMIDALKKSSKLSKKPISYREFQEVIIEIDSLKNQATGNDVD